MWTGGELLAERTLEAFTRLCEHFLEVDQGLGLDLATISAWFGGVEQVRAARRWES